MFSAGPIPVFKAKSHEV